MSDVVLVPLAWIRIAAAGLALAVVGVVTLGRCNGPTVVRLPAPVQVVVDRHAAASIADTVTTHRLERDTAAANRRARAALALRATAEDSVRVLTLRADSLAAQAVLARTATDSAAAWHAAYDVRTIEADSLVSANRLADTARAVAANVQAATDSIAAIWKTHALRGDSALAAVVQVAAHPNRCRIALLLPCPTRSQAAIVGAVAGAATVILSRRLLP